MRRVLDRDVMLTSAIGRGANVAFLVFVHWVPGTSHEGAPATVIRDQRLYSTSLTLSTASQLAASKSVATTPTQRQRNGSV